MNRLTWVCVIMNNLLFSVGQDLFSRLCHRSSHFVDITGSESQSSCYILCRLIRHLVLALSVALLSNRLDFLCLLTFWLCQPSLLYPPVSCLIIEVSVCLRGAPQYLLIKASVCVCLFISGCYSRRSPGALMRHKPPLPTEAYTVSCHCTSSHSKHCQNEIFSLSTSVALLSLNLSIYIVCIYSHTSFCWSFPHCLTSRQLGSWESSSVMKGMLEVVSPSKFFSFPLHLSSFCFSPTYRVHLHFHIVLCGFFSHVTPPPTPPHTLRAPNKSFRCW